MDPAAGFPKGQTLHWNDGFEVLSDDLQRWLVLFGFATDRDVNNFSAASDIEIHVDDVFGKG